MPVVTPASSGAVTLLEADRASDAKPAFPTGPRTVGVLLDDVAITVITVTSTATAAPPVTRHGRGRIARRARAQRERLSGSSPSNSRLRRAPQIDSASLREMIAARGTRRSGPAGGSDRLIGVGVDASGVIRQCPSGRRARRPRRGQGALGAPVGVDGINDSTSPSPNSV
jgi:hypothetical protein